MKKSKILIIATINLVACGDTIWDPYSHEEVREDELNPPLVYKTNEMYIRFDNVEGPNEECLTDSLRFLQRTLRRSIGFEQRAILDELQGYHLVFSNKPQLCTTSVNGVPVRKECNGFIRVEEGLIFIRLFPTMQYPFYNSAWYHELGHMIQQRINEMPVDYDHDDYPFWAMIQEVQEMLIKSRGVDCVR